MLQTMLFVAAAIVAPRPEMPQVQSEEHIHIEFEDQSERDNRSPANAPVSGSVDSLTGVLFLSFTVSCGTVQVQMENFSDGTCYSTSVAGTGVVMVPVCCSSGSWRITLTTSGGTVYVGEFTI